MNYIKYNNKIISIERFFEDYFDEYCFNISQNKQDLLSKKINYCRKKKYPKHCKSSKKYEGYSKALTHDQFKIFLKNCNNTKFELMFKLMYFMGLRVGEVNQIKNYHINNGILSIINSKNKKINKLPIPLFLMSEIESWIHTNNSIIKDKNNFVFYSQSYASCRNNISEHHIRNRFRKIIEISELDTIYDYSEESFKNRDVRKLHLYTTHSLRHSFCINFYNKCNNDIEKTRIAMRHSDIKTTQKYINYCLEEVWSIMRE